MCSLSIQARKVRIDERLYGDKALDGQADAGLLRSNLALQADGKEIVVAGASGDFETLRDLAYCEVLLTVVLNQW